MLRALELAEKGRGRTSPNPMVGAVLVKNGIIVGEGFHPQVGQAHAEIYALDVAKEKAQGASLYVNLEPCSHYGRTPPCTQALIQARVAKVHIAMLDPNPMVNGQGKKQLEAAGIATHIGECEEEAQILNEVFTHWITHKTPYVYAKYAMSLDGKIATQTGDSRWITSAPARTYVHQIRNQVDAILVGIETVLADNPQLTTRLKQENISHPLRVILDSQGRIPLDAKILDKELPGETLLVTTKKIPAQKRKSLEEKKISIEQVSSEEGRIDLQKLLQKLGEREVTSLLVEGGSQVLGSFFEKGLVNKVMAFVAPIVIGGKGAPSPVGGKGPAFLREAWRLEKTQMECLGPDFLIQGYPVQNR